MTQISRNGPCPCGSGKKFKRCCGSGSGASGRAAGAAPSAAAYALNCYQQGNVAGAVEHAELALRQNSRDPLALELLGAVYLQSGKAEKALPLYKRLLPQRKKDANLHNNLCMALHAVGQDEEANIHCHEAIRLAPELAEPYNNLGNIYKDRGHPLDALQWYEKAIQHKTQNPLIYVNAAAVCHKLFRYEEAKQYSKQALALAADFPPALNALALAQQHAGELDEALESYDRLIALAPQDAEFRNNYATCLQAAERYDEAESVLQGIIESAPDYLGAQLNLALLHDTLGDKVVAERLYREVLARDPDNSTAHFNLGELLFDRGEQAEAISELTRALESDPNNAKAYAGMAKALSREGSTRRAQQHIDRALELANNVGFIWAAKGSVENDLGNDAGAIAAWKRSLQLEPKALDTYLKYADYYSGKGDVQGYQRILQKAESETGESSQLYISWATMAESNNSLDESRENVAKAESLLESGENANLLRVKASLLRRDRQYDEAFALIQMIDAGKIDAKSDQAALYFELARIEDKRKNYKQAFAAYKRANELKNAYTCRSFSDEADRASQKHEREFFSANLQPLLSIYDELPEDMPQPVFIVGFPRSGTSLLEQILGAHAEIAPAGELRFMPLLAKDRARTIVGSELDYPECLHDPEAPLDLEKLVALRNFYLDGVRDMGIIEGGARWITDKLPHNGLRLGLISLLFPKSPIIHISRHPLNPCLSAYFSNFNLAHDYSESLESTAKHYRNFMETVNYYKNKLPMRFMELHYEDLVGDQEDTVRQLLEFIEAPWDENCLQHHKSKRLVKTASYEQVTQKVYRGSLERYKNYWEAVQPIIPILEETIREFGYTVEAPDS